MQGSLLTEAEVYRTPYTHKYTITSEDRHVERGRKEDKASHRQREDPLSNQQSGAAVFRKSNLNHMDTGYVLVLVKI